ncbi:uncharacterized protein [Diabrotica undecimpunctata]|uniref:uncharacterized protein n=1 Tax=Diabrotica undecimpunctata TaxID=50387 RepID=UPI003B633967
MAWFQMWLTTNHPTTNKGNGRSARPLSQSEDLYILNRGTEPTFINVRSQTVIDIILVTAEISNKIQNWQVSEDTSMSDHRCLTYNISLENSLINSRDSRRTDVELYNRLLEDALRNEKASTPGTNTELERYTVSIQNKISYAYKKSCPIRMVPESRKRKTNSWWCTELEHLRKIARTASNRAKCTKLKEDWDTYQSNLREFKKICRQRQRAAWRTFCEEIEDFPKASRLQKALSKDSHRQVGLLTKEDGHKTSNPCEISNNKLGVFLMWIIMKYIIQEKTAIITRNVGFIVSMEVSKCVRAVC